MVQLIIFDYDGVIVDSFICVHNVYKIICKKLGKSCPEDIEDFRELYGYTSRFLMKNLGFNDEEVEEADKLFGDEIIKQIPLIFDGIKDVIIEFNRTYKLILLSASRREEVDQKLELFGLSKYFEEVYASDIYKPLKKSEAIKEIIEKYNQDSKEIIMIADREVDFNVGVKMGVLPENIIIVEYGWGYDHSKVLKQEPLVNKPKDLLLAVKKRTC